MFEFCPYSVCPLNAKYVVGVATVLSPNVRSVPSNVSSRWPPTGSGPSGFIGSNGLGSPFFGMGSRRGGEAAPIAGSASVASWPSTGGDTSASMVPCTSVRNFPLGQAIEACACLMRPVGSRFLSSMRRATDATLASSTSAVKRCVAPAGVPSGSIA